jgi:outer membrane protein assembly factor BamB
MNRAGWGLIVAVAIGAVVGCAGAPTGQDKPQGDKPPTSSTKVYQSVAEKPVAVEPKLDIGTRRFGHDWPGFLGPTQDSKSAETGIKTDWGKQGLPIVWKCPLGAGYAAPSISNGRLFHFDRYGDQATLTCRKSETGELLWQFSYPTDYEDDYGYSNGPRCCPVVDQERVYIFGPEGMLHCVNSINGKLLWKVNTATQFNVIQNFFGVGSTPVVYHDLLITMIGGSPQNSDRRDFANLQGNGSGIVAFNKYTGEVVYTVSNELASYASPIVRRINDLDYGLAFCRGGLLGFNPRTGEQWFTFPWRARILESVNASNPVVFGDKILITECYGVGTAVLRVKDKAVEVVWSDKDKGRQKSLECHWNTPIYVDGYIYGSSGRHLNTAELRCIEADTGKVCWRNRDFTRSSLLYVDKHFLCLTEDGHLHLFEADKQEYRERARMQLEEWQYPCWAAPVLSHGLLYVRGRDQLVCLELIAKSEK